MPITVQQKKAIGFNQAGWRSAKHLRQQADEARGKPGAAFLHDLPHARRVGWVQAKKPAWAKETYYRLTAKGRRYLEQRCFKAVLEAFRLPESVKLAGSRAELQRQGWFSVKHVGRVDVKLVEAGYYEMATRFRQKVNGTFFRLTKVGRVWARQTFRARMEAELRAEFRKRRTEEVRMLNERCASPAQLVKAWRE